MEYSFFDQKVLKVKLYVLSNVDRREKKPLDNKFMQIKLIIIFDVKFKFKDAVKLFIVFKYGWLVSGKYLINTLNIEVAIIKVGASARIIK